LVRGTFSGTGAKSVLLIAHMDTDYGQREQASGITP